MSYYHYHYLGENIVEGIHKINCKDYDFFLEYESVKTI